MGAEGGQRYDDNDGVDEPYRLGTVKIYPPCGNTVREQAEDDESRQEESFSTSLFPRTEQEPRWLLHVRGDFVCTSVHHSYIASCSAQLDGRKVATPFG